MGIIKGEKNDQLRLPELVLLVLIALDFLLKAFFIYRQNKTSMTQHFKMDELSKKNKKTQETTCANIEANIWEMIAHRKNFNKVDSMSIYLDLFLTILIFICFRL